MASGFPAIYRAATTAPFLAAAGTLSFFVIGGSNSVPSRPLLVRRIGVSGLIGSLGIATISCKKYSTAPSGGTITTLTKTPIDSTSRASTASLVQVYTAGPTDG